MTWTTRRAGLEDAPAILAVYEAFDLIELGAVELDVDDVLTMLRDGSEWWLAEDGGPVGAASVHPEGQLETVVLPGYDPALREELLARVLARARELGVAKATHYAGAGMRLTGPFLQPHGFVQARISWKLSRALPADSPSWPTGIEVRPYDRARDARDVWGCVGEAFRSLPFSTERTFEQWAAIHLDNLTDVVCAWDGDVLAGCATRGTLLGQGYLPQLGVRPTYRGRGLGRALLLEVFARDTADGHTVSSLDVDGQNDSARQLYDSVGMAVVQEFRAWELVL